jgi:hypothetical protein
MSLARRISAVTFFAIIALFVAASPLTVQVTPDGPGGCCPSASA